MLVHYFRWFNHNELLFDRKEILLITTSCLSYSQRQLCHYPGVLGCQSHWELLKGLLASTMLKGLSSTEISRLQIFCWTLLSVNCLLMLSSPFSVLCIFIIYPLGIHIFWHNDLSFCFHCHRIIQLNCPTLAWQKLDLKVMRLMYQHGWWEPMVMLLLNMSWLVLSSFFSLAC